MSLIDALRITLVAALLIMASLALWLDYNYLPNSQWLITNSLSGKFLAHALISVGPELAGIVTGIVTIDYLNERRQEQQLKSQLIRELGSRSNDFTVRAARELRHYGWLRDGSLRKSDLGWAKAATIDLSGGDLREVILENADLRSANLSEADLSGGRLFACFLTGSNLRGVNFTTADVSSADLSNADLSFATLSGAVLNSTNLSGANLTNSDLAGADLFSARLEGANLTTATLAKANLLGANLRGARLAGANLSGATLLGADLRDAILRGANLVGAKLNVPVTTQLALIKSLEGATMPDGTKFEEWQQKRGLDWKVDQGALAEAARIVSRERITEEE